MRNMQDHDIHPGTCHAVVLTQFKLHYLATLHNVKLDVLHL